MTKAGPQLIAHRGGNEFAPENSQTAIKHSSELDINGIEFDIRLSSDHQFIVCHDKTFYRTANNPLKISSTSLKELTSTIKLGDSLPPPDLKQALKLRKYKTAYIEAKGKKWATDLSSFIKNSDASNLAVLSFNYEELAKFHSLQLKIPCIGLTFFRPLHCLKQARSYGFSAIGTHWISLNPIIVWLARRWDLSIYIHTVNNHWLAKTINNVYPNIFIVTDKPDRILNKLSN